jgi:hypothetical protein
MVASTKKSREINMAWLQRSEWGAPAPKAALQRMALPVSTVFLHHTVTPVSNDSKADMRKVTNYSKYVDVPYTVVVHPNGDILTGRYLNGVPALGAHTGGHNSTSLGIALIGRYDQDIKPTDAAIESIAKVLNAFAQQGFITKTFQFKSHSDAPYATACCGTNLKAQISAIFAKANVQGGVFVPQPLPQVPDQKPVSSMPAYPMLLVKGSKNVYVRQFQQKLRDRGWNIAVDGDFGSKTDAIVRQFQKEKGLQVDGKVGVKTWNAIWKAPVT